MTRPRLLIMSFSPLHRDARVLRQVRLFRDEYDVVTCGYGPAPDGVVEHVRIPDDIVYWHVSRPLVLAGRYQRAYDTAPVIRFVTDALTPGGYDIVLANDLLAVPAAVRLQPIGGVHADLHEYATRQQEESWRWRWFVAPYYRSLVRRWVARASSVTTVGHALAAEYRREFGIAAEVVYNAPDRQDLEPTTVPDPPRLVHAGLGLPERLETLLEAMTLVRGGATLDLFLVGEDGAPYLRELRARYAQAPAIRIHAGVPPAELVRTLNTFDVGVHVLTPISFNHRYAMPNKIFDYVQARLGVLTGPNPEMAALVREHGVGWVSEDWSPAAVATTIDALTPDTVGTAKAASDLASRTLCAQEQVGVWKRAIDALAERVR